MKIHVPGTHGKRQHTIAFTMVEAAVSFSIMGITFIGLFSGLAWGFTMVQWTREDSRATQVMLDKMEQFRLFNWDQIVTNSLPATFNVPYYEVAGTTESSFSYTGAISVEAAPINAAYADNLRTIRVQVGWTSGGLSHSREIQTLVGKNGLQKYLF